MENIKIFDQIDCKDIDIWFPIIHGTNGEDGSIQGLLKFTQKPFVGSGILGSALGMDKIVMKLIFSHLKIPQVNFFTIQDRNLDDKNTLHITCDQIVNKLNFPLFIKPNEGGSSFGISRITKRDDIIKSLKKCYKENSDALIEEEIQGREISVGVIFYNNEVTALPPTEIISHNEFFDYNAKYKGQSDEITPAELDESKIKEVKSLAIKIYQKLNLRGFTRSDFILKNNQFYFLEVNTNPGLTKESILPQQAKAAGININKLFESVLK